VIEVQPWSSYGHNLTAVNASSVMMITMCVHANVETQTNEKLDQTETSSVQSESFCCDFFQCAL
jgi:hypothetical protein